MDECNVDNKLSNLCQSNDDLCQANASLSLNEDDAETIDLVTRRRCDLFEARMRGEKPLDYEVRLANKYDVSRDTVKDDWYKRKHWIPTVVELIDANTIVAECDATNSNVLIQLRETLADIRQEIDRRRDEDGFLDMNDPHLTTLLSFQNTYLKSLVDSTSSSLKIYQSLGLVREQPKEVNVKTVSIDLNKALNQLDDNTKAEIQAKLLEIYESELAKES